MPAALRTLARRPAGRSDEPAAAATGSQSVKTAESGGPSGYDAGKKVNGRKRHITVDVEGTPISVAVHKASVQDRDGAPDVILAMPGRRRRSRSCGRTADIRGRSRRPRWRSAVREISWRPSGNRRKPGVRRCLPPLGGGADLRLDVALQASGEGPRADAGELGCLGAARGLPLPGAPGRAGMTP